MSDVLLMRKRGDKILTMDAGADIGRRVNAARLKKRLSMNVLAARAKTSHGYISQLEAGKIRSPGLEGLTRIAHVLEIAVSELLGEERNDSAESVEVMQGPDDPAFLISLEKLQDLDPEGYQRLRDLGISMSEQALRIGREERAAIQRRRDAQLAGPADSEVPPPQA